MPDSIEATGQNKQNGLKEKNMLTLTVKQNNYMISNPY